MSQPARFSGVPVSGGMAAGSLHVADAQTVGHATPEEVRAAFAAVAAERGALAERLRIAGRGQEAAIIDVGALIAADAALVEPAVAAVRGGLEAGAAVREAVEAQAAVLEALPVPELAQRADDVRQVGRAVSDHLGGTAAAPPPAGDFILISREVSPADLIELADVGLTGAVSVTGGASSHAAIIARGLGVPMIAGVDPAVLAAPAGLLGLLDADAGELIVGPSPADLAAAPPGSAVSATSAGSVTSAGSAMSAASAASAGSVAGAAPATSAGNGTAQTADGPALTGLQPGASVRTRDGQEITVMCNAASAAEVRRGLAAGAAGVGLLRTEIPFLGALAWPTPAEHMARLTPILCLLAGRLATVRLLDFSGDKIPPFLRGRPPATAEDAAVPAVGSPKTPSASPVTLPAGDRSQRDLSPGEYAVSSSFFAIDPRIHSGPSLPGTATGLTALLAHPTALRDQLGAVLEAGKGSRLAVLVPMVRSLDEVATVRDALGAAAAQAGVTPPPLGIMIELHQTAAAAGEFAPAVDFFSIGTNDLTGQVLGLDRRDPAAKPALTAYPPVLELIARVADAGRRAGISVSVCGDSAADPLVLPLLVGLGVRVLSVPAAQVPRVRSAVAELDAGACAALAADALAASTTDEVWKLVQAR
ncbi:MAG TPA: putative PEP-binding protein [Streptosporangiaceae bacterium]|nr:putative PEP-binding protein [Streptosporangiaceae bacterium]